MKSKLLLIALTMCAALNASAESIANSTLDYMIERYKEAKMRSDKENREISLACSGDVFVTFANEYIVFVATQNLNGKLINNQSRAKELIQMHYQDVEQIYPRFRENLVPALRLNINQLRESGGLSKIPAATLDKYARVEIRDAYELCNNPSFLAGIASQAPISGSEFDEVEGQIPRVDLVDGSDDFEDIIGDGQERDPNELVTVKMTVKKWLYEIMKR